MKTEEIINSLCEEKVAMEKEAFSLKPLIAGAKVFGKTIKGSVGKAVGSAAKATKETSQGIKAAKNTYKQSVAAAKSAKNQAISKAITPSAPTPTRQSFTVKGRKAKAQKAPAKESANFLQTGLDKIKKHPVMTTAAAGAGLGAINNGYDPNKDNGSFGTSQLGKTLGGVATGTLLGAGAGAGVSKGIKMFSPKTASEQIEDMFIEKTADINKSASEQIDDLFIEKQALNFAAASEAAKNGATNLYNSFQTNIIPSIQKGIGSFKDRVKRAWDVFLHRTQREAKRGVKHTSNDIVNSGGLDALKQSGTDVIDDISKAIRTPKTASEIISQIYLEKCAKTRD